MRLLTIDDEARAEIARVVDYASQPEHFYTPLARTGSALAIPGNNQNHVATLDVYRCIFSISEAPGRQYRHLSISVPGKGDFSLASKDYPDPAVVTEIAHLFGFTGTLDDWLSGREWTEEQHAIVIAQKV